MSTYYYVDPMGEHPHHGTTMVEALQKHPDWDFDPDSDDKSKWIQEDERDTGGNLTGWHPVKHIPTGAYLWVEYTIGEGIEAFDFKRYGGNFDAVDPMYNLAFDAGIIHKEYIANRPNERTQVAVWDEHQMSEYAYEQDLAEKMREPGLEEFETDVFSDISFIDAANESGVIAAVQGQVHRDEATEETLEVWKHLKCAHCGITARFIVEDTPLGSKPFCSEIHMSMYLGLPMKTKGYYGKEEELGAPAPPPAPAPTTTYAITEHPDLDWQKGDLIYEFDTREEAEKCLREQLDSGETMEEDGCEVVALNAEGTTLDTDDTKWLTNGWNSWYVVCWQDFVCNVKCKDFETLQDAQNLAQSLMTNSLDYENTIVTHPGYWSPTVVEHWMSLPNWNITAKDIKHLTMDVNISDLTGNLPKQSYELQGLKVDMTLTDPFCSQTSSWAHPHRNPAIPFPKEPHSAMIGPVGGYPQHKKYREKLQRKNAEGGGGMSLTRGLEDIDEMSGNIRKAAESSSAINLEDGDTHKLVIQRGTVPYGIIEVTRSGNEVDIYSRRYHSVDTKHFRAPYQPNQTLGDYFTPDLVYTSTVSDDWMTSALRFGEGSVSAEEYASQGDMGLIARYAYEPSEHFNDPQWNETHGAEEEAGCYLCGWEEPLYHCIDCGRKSCTEKGHNFEVYTFTPYHGGECLCNDCQYRATTETGRVCEPCYRKNWAAEGEHPLGGPMSSLESRRLYYPYDSYGHHFATIFNKTAPMSVSYPMGEYKEGGDLDSEYQQPMWKGRKYSQKTWIPYGFLQITTEGQNVEMVVIDNEGEVLDEVQLLEDEDDEDFDFSPPKIIEGKRWDLGDIDGMSGVEKSMIWRRVEVGEAEPWPFLDVTVDVQGLGFHGVDSFQLTIQNPYTGKKYIDISVPVDNIPSGDWWEAESDLSEIEWQLDQQPDLFTDWMAWCENFPTDRKLHQQILIDTYREETGRIGSWDTAVEWWNTLPPRSQESIFNTGKVWNTFLTWRNALQWAAEDVPQVTKDRLSWLKDNRFPVLINVLDPKYAKKLSIPGSLNIPIAQHDKFKKEILKRVPQRDTLIVVYCANQTCDASYRAYNALKRMGYTNVFEYDAGVEGWFWPLTLEAEGDPPWVVTARKVLYGNDWWDVDWSVKDDTPKEDWIEVEWDAESDPNAYKGASSTTPSMSSLPSMTLPTLYKQDTKGKLRQWTISVEPHSSGNGFILISEAGLVTGNRTPKEGQHITAGSQNRTPFQQAELQARSKWKKKSDKGYYDDLQKAKGQVKTLPMTAHKYWKMKGGQKVMDRGRDINYPAVVQRKYDGVRAHLQVLPNGTVRISSRSGLPTGLLLTDIRSDALKLNLPDNIILDGEIYAGQKPGTTEPLHPLKLINGAVSSKTLKPKHMQILGDVQLYVYDAVLLDDPDADFVTRYRTAAKYLAPYQGNKFVLVPNYIVKNETEMEGLFHKYLQEGYEGLMIRNAKGPYQFSRSKNLLKVKPVEDDEFEIIGYDQGTGSHSGMVIWECALPNGKSFTVVPKGTHDQRKKWFKEAQQGQHIGKLLTVEYAYLTDDGVPFHPRGKNFYVKV